MADERRSFSFGWIPDYPDFRDYTEATASIREILLPTGLPLAREIPIPEAGNIVARKNLRNIAAAARKPQADLPGRKPKSISLPASADLREWCSAIEDQRNLGSCTANTGAGIIEYYERKAFGRHLDASRLFLYKVTRNLMKMKGDTGAFLRKTMGAMVLFGVPPEEYWPYTDDKDKFDKEPPAFCYAFAQNYKTLKYYRHDPPGILPGAVLERVKTYLAGGHPSMFGFTVYSSIETAGEGGAIPFPGQAERILGGHAVMAVGYDDRIQIPCGGGGTKTRAKSGERSGKGSGGSGEETTGALLVRNSWGKAWGDSGYGWLPYEYVLQGLAEDFWAVLKKEWIDTGEFNV